MAKHGVRRRLSDTNVDARSMRLHSYIVEHDLGFAPNPFHGLCTLATCKPLIRKYAVVGDYVMGTGAKSKKREQQNKIIYLMRIGCIINFDRYWADPQFARKKPVMNGSVVQRYGDNIYHRDFTTSDWIQEDSFHSREGGQVHRVNLETDTGTTDNVLIGDQFIYWGGEGPLIPSEFGQMVQKTQGHRSRDDENEIKAFLNWINSLNCSPSAPMRQIEGLPEGRISGSS